MPLMLIWSVKEHVCQNANVTDIVSFPLPLPILSGRVDAKPLAIVSAVGENRHFTPWDPQFSTFSSSINRYLFSEPLANLRLQLLINHIHQVFALAH